MLKALSTPFPNLATSRNAGVEFYAKFQRVADDYDRPFIKKYDEDLNSTLIFVSTFLYAPRDLYVMLIWGRNRPVCSPQSHQLSSSTFKVSSNRITKK